MDDTGTDIDAHGLFQFGNAYIVIIQCLNVVDLRFVEAQLGIEDIQVDTDAGLIADILDTVIFLGLVNDRRRFFYFLGRTADIEIGLLDFQLYRFPCLLFCFPGRKERFFGLFDSGIGSAAIP